MTFNENVGQAIVNQWFLLQMTMAEPPSAEDLFTKLHDAVEEGDDAA